LPARSLNRFITGNHAAVFASGSQKEWITGNLAAVFATGSQKECFIGNHTSLLPLKTIMYRPKPDLFLLNNALFKMHISSFYGEIRSFIWI
jgi:hypothetical protein